MQLRYVSTQDVVGPAQRYHRRADETNTSSSIRETVDGMHSGDGSSVSGTKFIGRLGRECNISRFR